MLELDVSKFVLSEEIDDVTATMTVEEEGTEDAEEVEEDAEDVEEDAGNVEKAEEEGEEEGEEDKVVDMDKVDITNDWLVILDCVFVD